MAKTTIYCVTYKGLLEKPPNTKHYTVYKVDEEDDETPPEMRSMYDITIRNEGKYRTCNCPGFTYHTSATARGPNHKHFALVRFYDEQISADSDEHPIAGIFIKMKSNGSMERIPNPFSTEGLEDITS